MNEIEYYGATYDLDDRALRGFQQVRVVGPAANGVRRITETEFHLSDALAGQPRRARVFSEPAGGGAATLLAEQLFDYARQDGDEAEPSVALSAGGSAPLDPGPTRDAFLAWGMLVAGDGRASLAYPVASMQREYEGQATPLEAVSTRSFDLYGNLVHLTADDLADPRSPEFEASIDYAILDDVFGGQQMLLANRPASVVATGDPTGLPSGTATQRESRIFYDQSATLGNVLRGNPTRSQQLWLTQWVERQTSYDPFGNPVTLSAPRLVDSPDPMTLTLLGYDPATQSFVETITRAFGTPLELVTMLEYARSPSSGCGVPPADARFAGDPDPGAAPIGMGLVCAVIDPNGQVSDLYYDRFGRLVNERGPGGFERATSYRDADLGTFAQRVEEALRWDPSAGAPAADANAITSARYLDGLGRSHTEVRRGLPASGPDVATRTLAYDAAGRLQSSSRWKFGGGGPLTTFQYDALDRPTRIDLPGGIYSTSTYERRGVVREDFLPGEGLTRKKRILLDGFGRIAQLHEFADPGASIGAITSYLYDPFGALVSIDDPIANDPGLCPQGAAACPTQQHTTTIRYDNRGDRVSIDDPDAGLWLFVLDERRRVGMQFNADGFVHFTHDELDRLTGRTSDSEQSFEYGLAGSAPPNGVGRLLRATDASGEDAFGYDEAGNVAFHRRTLDGLAFEFTRTFDPLGRTLSTEYPDGELVSWHYERQLLQRISSSGGTYAGDYLSDARYDALDRPESLGLGGSAGSPVLAEARDYDPTTALLDRIDAVAGGQTVASGDYTLDGLGRVRAIQSLTKPVGTGAPQAIPAVYDYDGLDRLLETVHGTYAAPRNEFDVLGNLRKKDEAPGMGWLELDYEDPVRPHAVTSATPVSSATAAAIAYQYDPMGRVSLKTRSGGAPGPASTSVTYDLLGLPKTVTPSGGLATTFAYSALDLRVKTARADETVLTPEEGFEYLKNTQIASKHFFVDGRRIASSAVAWAAPVAGSAKPLFDLRVQLPPPWAFGTGYALATLAALAFATRRRRGEALVPIARPAAVLTMALCTPALLASPCGAPLPAQTPLLGGHTEPVLFYATDHLGSTIAAVDQTGTVRVRNLYMPYGDVSLVREGLPLRHRYTGGEVVEGTSFYLLGVRLYDTETGRFLQPDPLTGGLANPQGMNRYSYALNNPVNRIDPTGMFSLSSLNGFGPAGGNGSGFSGFGYKPEVGKLQTIELISGTDYIAYDRKTTARSINKSFGRSLEQQLPLLISSLMKGFEDLGEGVIQAATDGKGNGQLEEERAGQRSHNRIDVTVKGKFGVFVQLGLKFKIRSMNVAVDIQADILALEEDFTDPENDRLVSGLDVSVKALGLGVRAKVLRTEVAVEDVGSPVRDVLFGERDLIDIDPLLGFEEDTGLPGVIGGRIGAGLGLQVGVGLEK